MPLSEYVPSASLQQLLLSQPLTCEIWSHPLDFFMYFESCAFHLANYYPKQLNMSYMQKDMSININRKSDMSGGQNRIMMSFRRHINTEDFMDLLFQTFLCSVQYRKDF